MRIYFLLFGIVFLIGSACSKNVVEIENTQKDSLEIKMSLDMVNLHQYELDSLTPPRPEYIQMYEDTSGLLNLTFLNSFDKSIYFYDYASGGYLNKIDLKKEDSIMFVKPKGYHIKNLDSIYVYDMQFIHMVMTNDKSLILDIISYKGEPDSANWYKSYPQYLPRTVQPFYEVPEGLLLTGQHLWTLSKARIEQFEFTSLMNFKTKKLDFKHKYPKELYGFGYNWQGFFSTSVYSLLHPDGNKMIYSFPVSHDLYMYSLDTEESSKFYAGSIVANTITSIDEDTKNTPHEVKALHFLQQDMYAGIVYDKYRKVYYRFLRKGIPNATLQINKEDKPIVIIILDDEFNYLGEKNIGTGEEWNWENSFVTEEGLNIEYIDKDDIEEHYLNFKTFIPIDL